MSSSCWKIIPVLIVLTSIASCAGGSLPEYEIDVAGNSLTVEVAATADERATGLMNRRQLAENRGMLFVFEREQLVSFWMKDTLIPLSIAYITSDGTIRQIEELEALSLASVPSSRSIRYALEVNRGWFDERGITVGDRVAIPEEYR